MSCAQSSQKGDCLSVEYIPTIPLYCYDFLETPWSFHWSLEERLYMANKSINMENVLCLKVIATSHFVVDRG